MKTATVFIFLIGIIVLFIPAIAQDLGTPVSFELYYPAVDGFGQTDWSPDGEWIAVTTYMPATAFIEGEQRYWPKVDIMLYSTESGEIINMTDDIDNRCFYPRFTPDSKEISFSTSVGVGAKRIAYYTIESIDISTRAHRIIREEAYGGDWSKDGRYFAYVNAPFSQSKEDDIVLYDYTTNTETYFGFSSHSPLSCFGRCRRFRFSPDNSHIVSTLTIMSLLSGPNSSIDNHAMQIHQIPVDGSLPEVIPLGNATFFYPEYSPDGIWMLFVRWDFSESYMHPDNDIQIYNTETGEIIDLLPGNEYDSRSGSWSPDGKQICYVLEENGDTGLYIKEFESVLKETHVNEDDIAPLEFAIRGNYPNPFNPLTTIEFSLPESGSVNLVIYNQSGQKVRNLMSGYMKQGTHTVVWDGRDDRGRGVSSGVYITHLKTRDKVTAKQMMMLK